MNGDVIISSLITGAITWGLPFGLTRSLEYYQKNE